MPPAHATSSTWRDSQWLAQLLGICPLAGMADTLISGLALGIATILAASATSALIATARPLITPTARLPVCLVTLAACVTLTDLIGRAFAFELHLAAGAALPLIAANCTLMGRSVAMASSRPRAALADGLALGVGSALLLIGLGTLRELAATGGVVGSLSGSGTGAASTGFALAAIPAGAFFALGLLAAAGSGLAASRGTDGGGFA